MDDKLDLELFCQGIDLNINKFSKLNLKSHFKRQLKKFNIEDKYIELSGIGQPVEKYKNSDLVRMFRLKYGMYNFYCMDERTYMQFYVTKNYILKNIKRNIWFEAPCATDGQGYEKRYYMVSEKGLALECYFLFEGEYYDKDWSKHTQINAYDRNLNSVLKFNLTCARM